MISYTLNKCNTLYSFLSMFIYLDCIFVHFKHGFFSFFKLPSLFTPIFRYFDDNIFVRIYQKISSILYFYNFYSLKLFFLNIDGDLVSLKLCCKFILVNILFTFISVYFAKGLNILFCSAIIRRISYIFLTTIPQKAKLYFRYIVCLTGTFI